VDDGGIRVKIGKKNGNLMMGRGGGGYGEKRSEKIIRKLGIKLYNIYKG
jgi:hypothetical protein